MVGHMVLADLQATMAEIGYANRLRVHACCQHPAAGVSWNGAQGKFTAKVLDNLLPKQLSKLYACWSPVFMRDMAQMVLGVRGLETVRCGSAEPRASAEEETKEAKS